MLAIYGGTFNPFHMGHVYCIQNIIEKTKVEKVKVVPAYQNPLKDKTEGPTPQQRLEMAEVALRDYEEVEIDNQEIQREGKSYSILTVKEYLKEFSSEELFLVIGLDEFYQLHKWHQFEELLSLTNFLVISRPGNMLPFSKEDLPEPMRPFVSAIDRTFIALTTDRYVEFLKVPGLDIAATDIRKYLRTGRSVDKFLDHGVQDYIKEKELYPLIGPKVGDYKDFTKYCADRLFYRKAINLKAFDLEGSDAPSKYVMIASGTSKRHAQSLATWVRKEVREAYGLSPLSIEGAEEGRWVLMDYGSLIIHIFYDYVRTDYHIEALWDKKEDLNLLDPYQGQDED